VSSVAKASKIAFMVPVSETATCAAPQIIHPYVFRRHIQHRCRGVGEGRSWWPDGRTWRPL